MHRGPDGDDRPGADRARIGIGLQSDKSPGSYAPLAALAESHGIDVVSVFSDLLYQPPIAALLEMAAATERVQLGAACWNPYTLHPYEIAGQLATLDLASDGRAYLGLARGTWLGAIGVAQPRPLAHLAEAAAVIAALLAGSEEGVDGEVFSLSPGTTLRYPRARPKVPLLLGTWGPRGAALAGGIADELKLGGTANPAMVAVTRERLAVGAAPAGRRAEDVGIVLGAVTVVDTDGPAARRRARREVAMSLDGVAELDPTVTVPEEMLARVRGHLAAGDHDAAGAAIGDEVLELFAFAGTPDQVAAQAQAVLDAGADRVEFGTPHGLTDHGGIELIGSRVLPQLDLRAQKQAAAR